MAAHEVYLRDVAVHRVTDQPACTFCAFCSKRIDREPSSTACWHQIVALKFTRFPVTPAQQQRIEEIGRGDGWSILPPSVLDTIFPSRYLSKIDATIRVAEPTSSGRICVMFNSLRVDMRTRLIDQDPLAFFQNSTGLTAVGVHVHHGSWAGRSWEMSSRLWRHIAEQGVGGYFLANPPGNARSGTLDDLPKSSADALLASLTALRSL